MSGAYLTARQAAEALGLTQGRIYQLLATGELDGRIIGHRWRIALPSVGAYRDHPRRWAASKPWLVEALERCRLTSRQRQVCELVAGGLSQAETARRLGVGRAVIHAVLVVAQKKLAALALEQRQNAR